MVDTGYIAPVGKIAIAGHRQTVEMNVETAADMYPGRLVQHGSTNNDVIVGTAGALSYGWLVYEDTPIMYRPKTVDTVYNVLDRAAVMHGPGMILVGSRKGGVTIVMGDKLICAAAGQVDKWTPVPDGGATGEEEVVAVAMEDGSGDSSDLIIRSSI
jgi:hypothetical protein